MGATASPGSFSLDRLRQVLVEELAPIRPWTRSTSWVIALLPTVACIRIRTRLMGFVGWKISPDAALFGVPRLYGGGRIQSRLTIGRRAMLNVDCTLDLNECVTIGADAALGHGVMVLTSSHDLGRHARRAGRLDSQPVSIGAGAWIGANSIILPGVSIGDGAVVMAGSVVNADVPADALVAGAPATVVVKRLPK